MKRDCEGEPLAHSIRASFDSTKPLSDASRNGSLAAESQKLQQLEQQREQKTLKEAEERQRAEERKQRTRIGEKKKKREKLREREQDRGTVHSFGTRKISRSYNQRSRKRYKKK